MMLRLFFLLCCLVLGPAQAQEFLDPAVAFKPSARALDDRTLEVQFDIAKGYYLYRDKFRFAAEGATFGPAEFPKGETHQDENFGQVEVFYKTVTIRLPVTAPAGPAQLALKVTAQGCADAGVCYPPHSQVLAVDLPADRKSVV